jgi:hypothetical protein
MLLDLDIKNAGISHGLPAIDGVTTNVTTNIW